MIVCLSELIGCSAANLYGIRIGAQRAATGVWLFEDSGPVVGSGGFGMLIWIHAWSSVEQLDLESDHPGGVIAISPSTVLIERVTTNG